MFALSNYLRKFIIISIIATGIFKHNQCSAGLPNNLSSPSKFVTTEVVNYCSEILDALNNDDLDKCKERLIHFYDQIPYDTQIKNHKNYYLSLFYCLCMGLVNNDPYVAAYNIYTSAISEVIAIALTNNTGKTYVLQFRAFDQKPNNIPYCEQINHYTPYDNASPITHVIGINLFFGDNNAKTSKPLRINIIENKPNVPHTIFIESQAITYNNYNLHIFKSMLLNIANNDQEDLQTSLSNIYNAIPLWLRSELQPGQYEKYYQGLFFVCAKFIGQYHITAEERTNRGRIDIALRQKEKTIVIEFKHNQTTTKAIEQIKTNGYCTKFKQPVTMLGININTDTHILWKSLDIQVDSEQFDPAPPSNIKPYTSSQSTSASQPRKLFP
jgi:hypothetical protein